MLGDTNVIVITNLNTILYTISIHNNIKLQLNICLELNERHNF